MPGSVYKGYVKEAVGRLSELAQVAGPKRALARNSPGPQSINARVADLFLVDWALRTGREGQLSQSWLVLRSARLQSKPTSTHWAPTSRLVMP